MSFTEKFPNAKTATCLFHMTKSIFKKICDLGLRQRYQEDDDFNLHIRCFSALAFLPIDDVIDGFLELIDEVDLPAELVSYFEATYIGEERGRGGYRRRLVPNFAIPSWNVHQRTTNDLPRTNNSVEAWHNTIQNAITCKHPTIWKLIDAIKKEEALALKKKIDFDRGIDVILRHKYKDVNKRLQNAIERYNPNDKITFLRGIAHNMHRF